MEESLLQLRNIHIDDLHYLEKDLCFYELVSLGLLLFGGDRSSAEFVLQRLLVLASNAQQRLDGQPIARAVVLHQSDLLHKYATINPGNWRECLVEALCVIGARRVIRKLGLNWDELRQYYLPHITELSLNLNPLLKVLYRICERLTPAHAGRLMLDINDQHREVNTHLRFYDPTYLEIFLLDWLTRRIISVGAWDGSELKRPNVQVLVDYFKLNDMDAHKMLLLSTISCNANARPVIDVCFTPNDMDNADRSSGVNTNNTDSQNNAQQATKLLDNNLNESGICSNNGAESMNSLASDSSVRSYALEANECYTVRREAAGLVAIFNQRDFYEETDEELKHLLPLRKLTERRGTDVDKQRLIEVFAERGYLAVEYDNLTHTEMCYRIREVVKRSCLYDSLIVCILSHGIDGAVYGCNSIPVYINDIEAIILSETLRSKPKLLIIQACQKDEQPKSASAHHHSSGCGSSVAAINAPDNYTDLIKAMSTISGTSSIRNVVKGTWYIQALCNAVQELGDRKHMVDILIAVTRDVVAQRGNRNEFMVPHTSQTLTKYFLLPPRQQS